MTEPGKEPGRNHATLRVVLAVLVAAAGVVMFAGGLRHDFMEAKVARADALSGLGRGPEAEALYLEALALYPRNVNWMNRLANEVQNAERLDEADAIYDRILELRPGYVEARLAAGFLAARMKDLDKAIHHWETVLEYDPDNQAAAGNRQVIGKR